jgi:uncharacterized delta-60 repeat protein
MKKIIFPLLLFFIGSIPLVLAQPGTYDSNFSSGGGTNLQVYATQLQSDGKIIVAGAFNQYNGLPFSKIARLLPDGSPDTSFQTGQGPNQTIYSSCLQPDGKIIIGGEFTEYSGVTRNFLARLHPDGSLDQSFLATGTGPDDRVATITLQPDGKMLIGGYFSFINGIPHSYFSRLNSDGTADTSFHIGAGANNWVYACVLQPDGKILVAGDFTSFDGSPASRIVRLNQNGSVDNSFNAGQGANQGIRGIALQADGKIVAGGNFTIFDGQSNNYLVRINSDGTLDTSFNLNIGFNNAVYTLLLQPDGKIIAGGVYTNFNGIGRNRLVRLQSNGTLDALFDPGNGANSWIICSALQTDGKIIIGGNFNAYDGISQIGVARINGSCTTLAATDSINACGPYTWMDGITYPSSNNTATHLLNGAGINGCDSLISLNLNIQSLDLSVTQSGDTLTANAQNAQVQWLDCNNGFTVINGATAAQFQPGIAGNYAALISQNNCSDTTQCFTVVPTGKNNALNGFSMDISPNPIQQEATILIPHQWQNAVLNLVNSFGQTVWQTTTLHGPSIQLSTVGLAPGLYYLLLKKDDSLLGVKKVAIEK